MSVKVEAYLAEQEWKLADQKEVYCKKILKTAEIAVNTRKKNAA